MHYTPHIDLAFDSVEYIMRDVKNGWLLRYIHANGASMFFIVVYCHIGRGLYYGSYMFPRKTLWCSGVVIFLLMMATAFTGARVRRVEGFFIQSISNGITFVIHFLKACYGNVRSCLDIQNIISSVLNEPRVEEVKGFNQAFKISVDCLKALIGVVSRLYRALFFLEISLLIPKRLRIYFVASNYIKFVQTIHLSTLTYTFNYYYL